LAGGSFPAHLFVETCRLSCAHVPVRSRSTATVGGARLVHGEAMRRIISGRTGHGTRRQIIRGDHSPGCSA